MTTYKCLVCGGAALLFDVVDFNKNCLEGEGLFLPIMGHGVYYARCNSCEYTFAPEFSSWTSQDFLSMIYNDDYEKIDPGYINDRPQKNANIINNIFGDYKADIKHVDYGGGNGRLSELLRAFNWDSNSFDPFPNDTKINFESGAFNLITAFEVFEHVPNPQSMMDNINYLMDSQSGLVLFSTSVSDGFINKNERLTWWYVAPRNGHIGIHSSKSLRLLGEKYGFQYKNFSPSTHAYFKLLPDWANKLFGS